MNPQNTSTGSIWLILAGPMWRIRQAPLPVQAGHVADGGRPAEHARQFALEDRIGAAAPQAQLQARDRAVRSYVLLAGLMSCSRSMPSCSWRGSLPARSVTVERLSGCGAGGDQRGQAG